MFARVLYVTVSDQNTEHLGKIENVFFCL